MNAVLSPFVRRILNLAPDKIEDYYLFGNVLEVAVHFDLLKAEDVDPLIEVMSKSRQPSQRDHFDAYLFGHEASEFESTLAGALGFLAEKGFSATTPVTQGKLVDLLVSHGGYHRHEIMALINSSDISDKGVLQKLKDNMEILSSKRDCQLLLSPALQKDLP